MKTAKTLKKQALSAPATVMVWTVNDRVIENEAVLEREFNDLRDAGFDGLAVFVRCSRYSWGDAEAQQALARIGRLCRKHKLQYWLGPDPRFVAHRIVAGLNGLEVLVNGDAPRAEKYPLVAPIVDGRFNVRSRIHPRHVHTMNQVAIQYVPLSLVKVYAVRWTDRPLGKNDVIDITPHARMFHHAKEGYVEAFGRFKPPGDGWFVTPFFRMGTNFFDYSNPHHLAAYFGELRKLKEHGVSFDMHMWDEPGYTCTYGTYPWSPRICSMTRKKMKGPMEGQLWKLAFEAADGSHVTVRNEYYRAVQQTVNAAHRKTNREVQRLWGATTQAGIHDTWHFESADMADMNHGSMDLWSGAREKSGGFVDLGGINQLADPASPWYANLATMNVAAVSLARMHKERVAFNNLWTVGDDDGDGSQRAAMHHCVNAMALFGVRWLAHCYGPVGTIGEENTFLGSPPLPGYPAHSTWHGFPAWNRRLKDHFRISENRLPHANVLVLFPIETLYTLGDNRADYVSKGIFDLVLALLDAHYQVDLFPPEWARRGTWKNGKLMRGGMSYDVVLYPHPRDVDEGVAAFLRERGSVVRYVFGAAERTVGNRPIRGTTPVLGSITETLEFLGKTPLLKQVVAPSGTWVTSTSIKRGMLVSLMASRCGGTFSGRVEYGGSAIEVKGEMGELVRILFPANGEPIHV